MSEGEGTARQGVQRCWEELASSAWRTACGPSCTLRRAVWAEDFSSGRIPVFHGSVGEAPGGQVLEVLRTHLFMVRAVIRAMERMASGKLESK